MQTFDQSLMLLYRQNVITYEEAVRQSSNPDDFDKKEEPAAQNGKAPARPPPPARPSTPAAGRPAPTTAKPAAAKPAPAGGAPADDDFQIERF
ncbi:MAG TPA: type IV pili twitching motility protein PilT, partial [Myxococcales bacterium]|nr:type IV pili twitching motility protein PilT [Myxococcales bacterium]